MCTRLNALLWSLICDLSSPLFSEKKSKTMYRRCAQKGFGTCSWAKIRTFWDHVMSGRQCQYLGPSPYNGKLHRHTYIHMVNALILLHLAECSGHPKIMEKNCSGAGAITRISLMHYCITHMNRVLVMIQVLSQGWEECKCGKHCWPHLWLEGE